MSSDYWQQRREDLLNQMASDETDLNERLAEVYSKEAAALEKEIAAYYQRYGEGNVIEYRKLLASLTDDDRALLMERMDEFAAKYPQYAYLMPVRESIYRLNELEGLQTSIRIQQLEIGAIEQDEMQAHFEQQALKAANLAAEQMGFGSSFYSVNAAIIRATVGAAWAQGKSYSERIWDNREKLAAYLSDDFAKAIARGATYESCVKELRQRFENVSRRDAYRLVYTEGTFLFNEAQAQVHKQDFECYRITCIHDGKACKACLALEAEQKANPVRYDDEAPGVNFPPLHPWCRCCAVPAVDDWDAWIDDYVASHGGDAVTPSYAMQLLNAANVHEPTVTSLLKSMEGGGARLSGLEYRIKGQESLERKIRTDAASDKLTQAEAASRITDVLRYTYVTQTEGFTETFERIREELASSGYTVVMVKNTLQYEDVGYRGVNTKVATPDGYVFEVQFHTTESLEVKEANHKLYERFRLDDTPEDEQKALYRQMVENSKAIPTPEGIEEVR